jgi:hypothetical protein
MSVEIGRTSKVQQLREEAVDHLEGLLADKLEEVAILQEQLALLSKHHVRETHVVDPYGDAGTYTGNVLNDMPNGKGTMKYDDGRIYVGEYRNYRNCGYFIMYPVYILWMRNSIREDKAKMQRPHR